MLIALCYHKLCVVLSWMKSRNEINAKVGNSLDRNKRPRNPAPASRDQAPPQRPDSNNIPPQHPDSNNIPDQSDLGSILGDEPSQSHELLRRSIANGVQEQWYYIGSQLRRMKADAEKKAPQADWLVQRLDEVLVTGLDYKRTLLRDLNNLTSLNAGWRRREMEALAEVVQARIRHTQAGADTVNVLFL